MSPLPTPRRCLMTRSGPAPYWSQKDGLLGRHADFVEWDTLKGHLDRKTRGLIPPQYESESPIPSHNRRLSIKVGPHHNWHSTRRITIHYSRSNDLVHGLTGRQILQADCVRLYGIYCSGARICRYDIGLKTKIHLADERQACSSQTRRPGHRQNL